MRAVIHTHPGVSHLRRAVNWLRGLPPDTCHIEYEWDGARRRGQVPPLAECRTCGRLHLRRPAISEAQVDSVIGRKG